MSANSLYDNGNKYEDYFNLLCLWDLTDDAEKKISDCLAIKGIFTINIYGVNKFAELFIKRFQNEKVRILCAIDQDADHAYVDLDVFYLNEKIPTADAIIIMPYLEKMGILEQLKGYSGSIIPFNELIYDALV